MHPPSSRNFTTMALGAFAVAAAVAFSSFAVVRAEHVVPNGSKTFTCRTGTACVLGQSNGVAAGVAGTSKSSYGVTGTTAAAHASGVYGQTTSSTAVGVGAGSSGSGPAMEAVNTGSGTGISAVAVGNDAISGLSQSSASYAIHGEDDAFAGGGVFGYTSGDGGLGVVGQADAQSGAALSGVTNGNALLLNLGNQQTLSACVVDAAANLTCTGSISGGALTQRHRSGSGRHVLAYAEQSATATMEDVGEGRLTNGVANVMIPADFASVIDRGKYYYVFLTPLGDTHGLYVSVKTAAGFQVRETMRGRSNVGFDYRIVAKPADANDDRLPPAPRMQRIRPAVHHSVPYVRLQAPAQ